MSTNKVNLSLDEIISKRKGQQTKSGVTQVKNSFPNNRRDFGERRRYLNKDFKSFSNKKNFQAFRRNSDNQNNNYLNRPEDSNKIEDNYSVEIEDKNEEKKGSRLFVSNLQRDVVNSELRVKI